MPEDTPVYFCRRIKSDVMAESMNNIEGRIAVCCQYYTNYDLGKNKYPCIKDNPKFRKCLVRIAVQRDAKERSRLIR